MQKKEFDVCIIGCGSVIAGQFVEFLQQNKPKLTLLLISSKNIDQEGCESISTDYENLNLVGYKIRSYIYDFSLLQSKDFYRMVKMSMKTDCKFVHISSNALLLKGGLGFKGDSYIRKKIIDKKSVQSVFKKDAVVIFVPNIIGYPQLTWENFLVQLNNNTPLTLGQRAKLDKKFLTLSNLISFLQPENLNRTMKSVSSPELALIGNADINNFKDKIVRGYDNYKFFVDWKKEFTFSILLKIYIPDYIYFKIELLLKGASREKNDQNKVYERRNLEGMAHFYLTAPLLLHHVTAIDYTGKVLQFD